MHMSDIYRSASVTVAAAMSRSSTEGFLQPRIQLRPIRMNVRRDDNVWGTMLAASPNTYHLWPDDGAETCYELFKRESSHESGPSFSSC